MINMKKMNKKQAGFTLIELVMVIVILGILSAFALPRFADLGGDARKAIIQGAFGSIKSASAIVHSAALADGSNPSLITMEGQDINLVNGYPQALAIGNDGILEAAQIIADDFDEDATGAGAVAASVIIVQAKGAVTPSQCQVSYTAAAANDVPTITINVDDC